VLLMVGSGNNTADFAAGRFQSYIFLIGHVRGDPVAYARRPVLQRPRRAAKRERPDRRGARQYDPFFGLGTSYEYDWVNRRFVRRPLMAGGGRWYPGGHTARQR
jgi:hypothetical protein